MANKSKDEKDSEIKLGEFYTISRRNTGLTKTFVLGNLFMKTNDILFFCLNFTILFSLFWN